MLNKIQAFLYQILNKRKDYPSEELFNYSLMFAVAIVSCSVHMLFTAFFLLAGSVSLSVGHGFGVLVFILSILLLNRRKYDLAGILLSVMILLSTFATIFTIGGNNFSILYQFLVLLMQMVIPFSKKKTPVIFASVLPFIMVGSYLFDLAHAPLQDIGIYNNILTVMNILVTSTGVILMLSLDKLVRSFIENYQRQRMAELEVQVTLDPLTGLYNRRYADSYFAALRAESQHPESYVAIGDIDNFKMVNDTYGHDAGDMALRMISEIFASNTRKSDLVFRWGGEEFLLIIHNVSADNAYRLLDKIRALISEQVVQSKCGDFSVTITIGLARLDPCDIPQSLESCDKKMYEGKRSTKNVVVM